MAAAEAIALDRLNLMRFAARRRFGSEAGTVVGVGAGSAPAERGPPVGTPEGMAHWLVAHRERQVTLSIVDPQQAAKQAPSCGGCSARSATPTSEPDRAVSRHRTMALFGTRFDDPAPYMRHLYERMSPDCHLVFI